VKPEPHFRPVSATGKKGGRRSIAGLFHGRTCVLPMKSAAAAAVPNWGCKDSFAKIVVFFALNRGVSAESVNFFSPMAA